LTEGIFRPNKLPSNLRKRLAHCTLHFSSQTDADRILLLVLNSFVNKRFITKSSLRESWSFSPTPY